MTKKLDIIGQKFDRLTVLDFVEMKNQRSQWRCLCICGKEKIVTGRDLKRGGVKSCGCLRIDNRSQWKGYEEISLRDYSLIGHCANKREIAFSVSIEEIWDIFIQQNRKCIYSGIELNFGKRRKGKTASLDRIDSNFGYISGNVQWVHKTINIMKSVLSHEEFLNWIKLIYENNFIQN